MITALRVPSGAADARWRICVALLALGLLAPRVAHAELYTFIDADGVVHFTNVADAGGGGARKPVPVTKATNTFDWRDELGAWRKIHRVDVRTYDSLIVEAAQYYSLPAPFIKAIIAAESSFEPTAVSPAGALGLMQLIPKTAAEVFVKDPFDARANIFGGTRYLRLLANRFGGDLRLTVAAYNAGPAAVDKVRDVPEIQETRRYVQRVLVLYKHYLAHWSQEIP